MRALGLHQPFAALIRLGIKTIETRRWSTPYRGPFLVCSTRTLWPGAMDLVKRLRDQGHDVSDDVLADIGTMQCTAALVGCREGTSEDEQSACCSLSEVNTRGIVVQKKAILLADVLPVVRKPVRCGRRWFNVDDALIEVERG